MKIQNFNTESSIYINRDSGTKKFHVTVFGGYKKYHYNGNLHKNHELSKVYSKTKYKDARAYYDKLVATETEYDGEV